MSVKDICPNCVHSETCQAVYQRLGEQSGSSVTGGVFAAFLLPLLVFITTLVVGQNWLPNFFDNRLYGTLAALLFASLLGFASMLLARRVLYSTDKDKTQGALKGE